MFHLLSFYKYEHICFIANMREMKVTPLALSKRLCKKVNKNVLQCPYLKFHDHVKLVNKIVPTILDEKQHG